MMGVEVEEIVARLELARHPEGGWFKECYRSAGTIPADALPGFGGSRAFCTSIYFLLERGDVSSLHRIKSDELWHFYGGTALTVHVLTPEGEHEKILLGRDLAAGESLQAVVPAGCWFGAEPTGAGSYSLVGCTVAPGFDFEDFEMGSREDLLRRFPAHEEVVRRLTHPS